MKIKKSFASKVLSLIMIFAMFSICTISASAKDISKSFSQGSHTFNKKWEVHAAWIYEASPGVSVQVGEYKYGFNTLFFNEDYTHLHAFDKKHQAYVKNSNGTATNNAKAGYWSKAEIRHSGNSVQYKITIFNL